MEKYLHNLQNYLSIGYIYLLLIGIVHDAFYYGFFGINIMNYAGVSDILLSPISYLIENWWLLPTAALVAVIMVFYTRFAKRMLRQHYDKLEKEGNLTDKDKEKRDRAEAIINPLTITMSAILGMYLGVGLVSGYTLSQEMKSGDLKANHTLVFSAGVEVNAHIIGQNGAYVFYVEQGSSIVTASPINGRIAKITSLSVDSYSDQNVTTE
ncbi:MAG: hypothetical protein AAFY71_20280 [Bacteroidota bacterium]